MGIAADHGIEQFRSARDFSATVANLENILRSKNLTVFAKIDFSGDAERAGLKMPPTQMLIFGNPKAGTPVMLAAPSAALDLPLKILVSQDAAGIVSLSFSTPEYLVQRHALPPELLPNIAGVRAIAKQASEN